MNKIALEAHDWFRGYYGSTGLRTQYSVVQTSKHLYTPNSYVAPKSNL